MKVSNHGSIPITIDCNVVAFIVLKKIPPAHKAHQTVSFSGCNGVSTYTCGLALLQNAAVLFVDVAIQPEVRFIAKQNSLMKIGNDGNLVFGPIRRIYALLNDRFDELPNQTERINHLTAVKSVAILETPDEDPWNSSWIKPRLYVSLGVALSTIQMTL
ncbi:hypothetical protein TNCV_3170191 [Trichonephila clavipes]|nr:hypothetical protein TNCV_3170191 [Trichonephila clavipes]